MFLDFHRKLITLAIDTLFPIRCVNCGEFRESSLCPKCMDLLCIYNVRVTSVDNVGELVAVCEYRDPLAAKVVKMCKYGPIPSLSENMATKILEEVGGAFFRGHPLLVPVPLFNGKEGRRGFNQAELLAVHIGKALRLRVSRCLTRISDTKPQSEIEDPEDRLRNVAGVFSMDRESSVCNERVILVDDVCTSGSTLSECAKVLIDAGAKKVDAVVFARG